MKLLQENTKIIAPQTKSDLLMAYRIYKQKESLTCNDLYLFLTTPSREREKFLELQDIEYKTDSTHFIELFYS